MTRRIPHDIKTRVLEQWILGIPVNAIALCTGIGYGSVYGIVELFKSKIPDLDVLRAVAVKINQEGLCLSDVTLEV